MQQFHKTKIRKNENILQFFDRIKTTYLFLHEKEEKDIEADPYAILTIKSKILEALPSYKSELQRRLEFQGKGIISVSILKNTLLALVLDSF